MKIACRCAFGAWALAAAPAFATELVTLVNGHQIRADRVEHQGVTARLIIGAGIVEISRAKIFSVETLAGREPRPEALPVEPAVLPTRSNDPKAPASRNTEELIRDAAERYGLPPELVRSVARTESGMQQDAISSKGAIGVMQLMPETAARLEADPTDLEQNVDAGTRYLRDLLVRYDGSAHKALAAYNAGERAVDRYGGVPPYVETQNYVRLVLGRYLRSSPPGK